MTTLNLHTPFEIDKYNCRRIKEYQEAEREELRRVVEEGTEGEKRALAEKNHKGIGKVRWVPGRVRKSAIPRFLT